MKLTSPTLSGRRAAAAVLTAGLAMSGSAQAVEFGIASVLSAQGQRLKVAIPYSTASGETVSVVQFQVVASRAPTGSFSPDPASFTISQPLGGSFVILQSRELIQADRIDLVLGVASHPDRTVRYELKVPD